MYFVLADVSFSPSTENVVVKGCVLTHFFAELILRWWCQTWNMLRQDWHTFFVFLFYLIPPEQAKLFPGRKLQKISAASFLFILNVGFTHIKLLTLCSLYSCFSPADNSVVERSSSERSQFPQCVAVLSIPASMCHCAHCWSRRSGTVVSAVIS